MQITIPDKLNLIKFPPQAEMTLFLISEEMKNRRCINRLDQAGFDLAYTADLSSLILSLVGFHNRSDELFEWYTQQLEEAIGAADPSDMMEWKQAAFDLYLVLLKRAKG